MGLFRISGRFVLHSPFLNSEDRKLEIFKSFDKIQNLQNMRRNRWIIANAGWIISLSDTVEKEWLTYFQSCEGEIVESAVSEYKLAMENMAGKVPEPVTKEEAGVVFSVDSSIKEGKDGYIITKDESRYQITGESESGLLYGVFHFLRLIRTKQMNCLPVYNTPEMPLRMMNHWDNMDGSIERGYSGNSFFIWRIKY